MLVRVGQNFSSWRQHGIAAVMQLMWPRFCSDCTLNDWFCVCLFQALVNILLIVCALRSFVFLVCCSYYLVLSNFAMTATHDILYKQLYVKIPVGSLQSNFVPCWPKLRLQVQDEWNWNIVYILPAKCLRWDSGLVDCSLISVLQSGYTLYGS